MIDSALFDKLPRKLQLAYVLGMAAEFFGRDQVARYYRDIAPLVKDMIGHGEVPDPKDNYWEGVWQVYEAE